MNKHLTKHNNRFHYTQCIKLINLKNYPEKWFCLVLRMYVDETLEPDPRAAAFGIREVTDGILKLTNGFELQCHRYGLNGIGYWTLKTTEAQNEIELYRTGDDTNDDKNKIATITISQAKEIEVSDLL